MNVTIPKNIFQTHKSLNYINSKPKLISAINSWTRFSSEFKYYFYDNQMCEDFMKNNFDEKINKAYSMLPMAVMKADLWRYCIIYKYGGIYADADTVCNIHPKLFINDSYLTVSPEINTSYFCQWTFSAAPGSPILKSIIDLSVDRILTTPIKGEHVIHYLTGPSCFTDGILKYLNDNKLPIFDKVADYHKYPFPIFKVFHPENFHHKFIQHLFAGDDSDGWKKERYNVLV
jgi:mannosyltransferase OCH1-like enzyme